jgi:phosphatidylserine/phosphatidylglycerophosphate/cardiolipin synthase-like enzyme
VLAAFLAACDVDHTPVDMTVHFCASPPGSCARALADLVHEARSEVRAAVYTFTSADLSAALASAARRGVQVWVLVEAEMAHPSTLAALRSAGARVATDGNPKLMHHKFAVIDGSTVATGSFNWTYSADRHHDENVIVLRSEAVGRAYANEFVRVWERAKP